MSVDQQKVIAAVQQMQAMPPDEAAKWLEQNQQGFNDDELVTILKKGATGGAPQTGVNKKNAPTVIARTAKGGKVDESVKVDSNEQLDTKADAAVAAGGQLPRDLTGDGNPSPAEDAAIKRAITKKAEEDAKAAGKQADPGQINADIDAAMGQGPPPSAILSVIGAQRQLTSQESFNLVKTYNEAHPDMPVTDVNQVYERLGIVSTSPTGVRREGGLTDPDAIAIIEEGLLGKEPEQSFSVSLPGGGKYTVSSEELKQFKGFQDNMRNEDLTRLVRAASRFGVKDANGEKPAWQMLAAIVKAKGLDIANTMFAEDGPQAPMGKGTQHGSNGFGYTTYEPPAKNGRTGPMTDPDAQKALSSGRSVASLSLKFKEGESMYGGNMVLAYIHTLNPTLAARWANTKPSERTADDQIKFNQYLANGGFTDKTFMGLSITSGDSSALTSDWDSERFGKNGGSGSVRSVPDPVAVRQSARDMYIKMFAAEPSSSQLDQFAAVVNGAIAGAADNVNVDAGARMQQAIEATPLYKDLYGNKPSGLTDAEYRAQFDNGAASLLGAEAPDPFTIQQGMRSGDYQTTLGAIAGTKQAMGNSTFLGRFAQAAQILAENT